MHGLADLHVELLAQSDLQAAVAYRLYLPVNGHESGWGCHELRGAAVQGAVRRWQTAAICPQAVCSRSPGSEKARRTKASGQKPCRAQRPHQPLPEGTALNRCPSKQARPAARPASTTGEAGLWLKSLAASGVTTTGLPPAMPII